MLEIRLGMIAIVAATSIDLSAVAVRKTFSLSDQFDDMERQNRIMMENLRQVMAYDLVEKLALKRQNRDSTNETLQIRRRRGVLHIER